MKTRMILMLLAFTFVGSQGVWAQKKDCKHGKQQCTPEQRAQQCGQRMAGKLLLDDATAAKFLPIYEAYLNELRECRQECRTAGQECREKRASGKLTDKERDQYMKDRFARERKMLDIREKYYDKFRKLLTPRQVEQIFREGKGCRPGMKHHARCHKPGKDGKPVHHRPLVCPQGK